MAELAVGGRPQDSWQSISLPIGPAVGRVERMLRIIDDLQRTGAKAQAAKFRRLYLYYVQSLRGASLRTAEIFEIQARRKLEVTQRRPDSGRVGPKLRDLVAAEAWDPAAQFATGWVSMGLIAELDKAINPLTGGSYWKVQEYGYQYRHTPTGFFMAGPGYGGASSRPNRAQAGLHPLFVATSKGGKFRSPPRVVARRYLHQASRQAIVYWNREMHRIDRDLTGRVERLTAEVFGVKARQVAR